MHLNRKFRRSGRNSFALIATLALLAVATILLVLFVSTTSLDRSASFSYSQSLKADQIALGGLHLVVSQLQAEMYKDQLPDTGGALGYPPVFTNVAGYNIQPQANVTNLALPTLIKMSTNAPFFTGTNSVTSYATGALQASTSSSTTPSLNSRFVSTNAWNQVYLGQYPNSLSTPYWVIMTRNGATSASSIAFGASGNTLNNSATSNPNYAVGRIAYAVYDEGGLLDVNAAGYPNSGTGALSAAQLNQIKGTLAGADLTQIPGVTSASTFIQWRNAASSASAGTFMSYVTNFASTNGYQQVYPGDAAFISRQDLIRAAQTGAEGFTNTALPYLTTFTRELNAPSWAPSVNGSGAKAQYNYAKNTLNITSPSPFTTGAGRQNPNPFIPYIRYTRSGTVTGYRSDGTTYTYTVNVGDSVVQHRFPLDRLNWITPKGPSASLATSDPFYNPGGTAAAIQACFGLAFFPSENISSDPNWTGVSVWKYVGPIVSSTLATSTAKEKIGTVLPLVTAIETLTDVGSEPATTGPREPNFFELLQAGVLAGSIALDPGSSQTMTTSGEKYPTLQLLRIGASMISQVQPQAYPINVEYNQSDGSNFSVVASGAANLPYIDKLKFITGLSTTDSNPGGGKHQMGVYGLFDLWNPHQQPNPASSLVRPPLALFLQGAICAGSGWSKGESGYSNGTLGPYPTGATTDLENGVATQFTVYGETASMAANTYYLPLVSTAGAGANGFLNPYPITSIDVGTPAGGTGSSTSPGWTANTSTFVSSTDVEYTYFNANHCTYEAFQMPDLSINLGQTGVVTTGNTSYDSNHDIIWLGNPTVTPSTSLPPFQLILKYKNPVSTDTGGWVPYNYWIGYNYSGSWLPSKGLRDVYYGATVGPTTTPLSLENVLHSITSHSAIMMTTDPRTMRFGSFAFSDDNPSGSFGALANPLIESLWSGTATGTGTNPNTSTPFDVAGYSGGTGTGIPTEFNALPAVFGSAFLPADLSRNNLANTSGGSNAGGYFSSYTDPDGIQRIGDNGLFSTSAIFPFTSVPNSGNPYYDPNDLPTINHRTADRPIILNRPFASVGELGYVFRDNPWRSLDFGSVYNGASTSADSGLLDLFTVTDTPSTVVAGRVNLNKATSTVLTAILNGIAANNGDTANNTGVTTLGNASGMAAALTTYTASTTLVNKDQLVTGFGPYLGAGTTVNTAFSSADEQNVKPYREAYVRALANVGQTRTWNLLIDMVAQSGKYPKSATTLDNFDVEGERHYWLHVAIDRFTGKVIDRQLESIAP